MVQLSIIALNFVYAVLGVVLMYAALLALAALPTLRAQRIPQPSDSSLGGMRAIERVATTRAAARDVARYDGVFRKYTKRYFGAGFDWRYFKAQGMAESQLNPTARSWVGARGIMQLMPS